MSKSISASLTSVSKTLLQDRFKKIDKSLEIAMMAEMDKIKPKIAFEVEAFMQHSVYPTYEKRDQVNMRNQTRFRVDQRKTGVSLSLHFEHPLLFARENGFTVDGATKWTPTNGKFLAIPFERAILSTSLAGFVAAKKKQQERSMAKKRESIYQSTVSKPQQAVDRSKGLKAKRLSEIDVGERPPQFLVFRELKVGKSPFMGQVADIMFRAVESKIGNIGDAARMSIQKSLDGRNA